MEKISTRGTNQEAQSPKVSAVLARTLVTVALVAVAAQMSVVTVAAAVVGVACAAVLFMFCTLFEAQLVGGDARIRLFAGLDSNARAFPGGFVAVGPSASHRTVAAARAQAARRLPEWNLVWMTAPVGVAVAVGALAGPVLLPVVAGVAAFAVNGSEVWRARWVRSLR